MAIYRGAGGPGDAITDAANEATVASNKATEAAASAAAAASSATAAAGSATSAASSATSAFNSATSATSSASSASTSASNANTSALAADVSAGEAAADAAIALAAQTAAETAQAAAEAAQTAAELAETNAETAETGAETAQAAAEAARDSALSALADFDDRYFGAFVDDSAVATYAAANSFTIDSGDLYFNTTSGAMQVYDGAAWLAAYVSGSGVLLIANNLSDLANASTARTNLGLGTAATTDSTAYATSAQGALADSAVQPGDLATVATTGAYSDLSGTPTLGTAAAQDVGYFATAAQGSLADSATQPGDNVSDLTNDAGYLTSFTETDPVYVASTWYSTTNNSTNWNTAYGWGDHAVAGYAYYPSQTGNSGKFLTTDGSNTSWATVDALPDQTGNAGEFLTTDGSTASWAAIATGNTTATGIWENSNTISSNYTITTNYNAMSVGPITVASGVTVEVPSGSTWVII